MAMGRFEPHSLMHIILLIHTLHMMCTSKDILVHVAEPPSHIAFKYVGDRSWCLWSYHGEKAFFFFSTHMTRYLLFRDPYAVVSRDHPSVTEKNSSRPPWLGHVQLLAELVYALTSPRAALWSSQPHAECDVRSIPPAHTDSCPAQ